MIPAEILEPVTLCLLIMITIGLSFAILALAGLALVQIFETIDYIKRRLAARRFFRQFKADKIRLEIDEAKQQEELRRI